MTTAIDIKNAAKTAEESFRPGCFNLKPGVKLVHKPSGQTVSAFMVDINGAYPNHVHTAHLGYWYPADQFEIIIPEVATAEPVSNE